MEIRDWVQLGVHPRSERWLDVASGWKSTPKIDLFVLEKQTDLCPSVNYFWCFSNLPKKFSKPKCFFNYFPVEPLHLSHLCGVASGLRR